MTQYLDASVLVPSLIPEGNSLAIRAFMLGHAGDFAVSDFAAGEVGSALSKAVRDQRIGAVDATARLADFDVWRQSSAQPVKMTTEDIDTAASLVRRFDLKLRLPDAIHAAFCLRLTMTLVTGDTRLADAAIALGIQIVTIAPAAATR